MQPLDQINRDQLPPVWAPEPLEIPAPGHLEHRDDGAEIPAREPEKPPGSHVVVIDIS